MGIDPMETKMDARWVPVLAAGLGVLGGVAGAFVGGAVANSGQAQQFDSEREAQREDLRLATYSKYAGAVDVYLVKLDFAGQKFGFAGDVSESVNAYVEKEVDDVFAGAAAVQLVAGPEVESAALTLRDAITHVEGKPPWENWERLRDDFIETAEKDIEASG
jgi:hypothetical protein